MMLHDILVQMAYAHPFKRFNKDHLPQQHIAV